MVIDFEKIEKNSILNFKGGRRRTDNPEFC